MTKTKEKAVTIYNVGEGAAAAEYQAALDHGHEEMNSFRLRRDDLNVAYDEALYGKGVVADVEREIAALDAERQKLEKRMDGAERRMATARKGESEKSRDEAAAKLVELDAELTKRHRRIRELVDEIRSEIFASDPLFNQMDWYNQVLGFERAKDQRSTQGVLNRTLGEDYARRPASIRNGAVIRADQELCKMFSPSGPLNRLGRVNPGGTV